MEDYEKIKWSVICSVLWYCFYKIVDYSIKLHIDPFKTIDTKSRIGLLGLFSWYIEHMSLYCCFCY